ncbi:MAG: HAD-IIIC family phosphatase [Proteobacteria bacterium]|nr:HAD-IIIC family phosphatase [Pseudomonadota bacterium]
MTSEKKIKCVVWDLDNTLWNGLLSENDPVSLCEGVVEVIKTLDNRGILQSVASKNDHGTAMEKIHEFGLSDFFLYPQINWNPKSSSIKAIAESINIGMDSLAFIDDQPYERDEVNFSFPDVLCIDAADMAGLLDMPEMNPRFITQDSKIRRQMYLNDIKRNNIEEMFEGAKEDFLASLGMVFRISQAKEEDLRRAEELTVRTHQLNTTGYTYSYDELDRFRTSEDHILLTATLDDKYGTYGKIGLALIERNHNLWTIKLLLMSCRVLSRGVGAIMINHIRNKAKKSNVRLCAEMIATDRNRMMYMTYKFSGFKEVKKRKDVIVFENDLTLIPDFPTYVHVDSDSNW